MRVSREQAARNRERVVDTAATLFRERGFDGIGVADLMQAAGLTHGGFYGQFESKEALMAEACAAAFEGSAGQWERMAASVPGEPPLGNIVRSYLSRRHRDRPGSGCTVAALGSEAARQGPPVRASVTQGVRSLIDKLAQWAPGRTAAARRERALATFAGMVGALVLSRAVDDEAFSQEILDAAAASLAGRT
jgi:TetR/AcrR family transcriptional repressor of nem operon